MGVKAYQYEYLQNKKLSVRAELVEAHPDAEAKIRSPFGMLRANGVFIISWLHQMQ
jgi:hypothetical protein